MAEAGGQQGSNPVTNKIYFCYVCNAEFTRVLDNFTCPSCNGGFIEEREAPVRSTSQRSNSFEGLEPLVNFLNRGLQTSLSRSRGNAEVGHEQSSGNSNDQTVPGSGGLGFRFSQQSPNQFSFFIDSRQGSSRGGSGGGGTGGGNAAPVNPMTSGSFENILSTFLTDLVSGLNGGQGGQLPFQMSNLGDYVWGRDGLDAIVTQLMNQMEGTGPPPLNEQALETLPTIKVTKEHVEKKTQCAVCWEDFTLNEEVKVLECDHFFHPDCILPWLKLHGTCPICRKDLTGGESENATAQPSTTPANTAAPNSNPGGESRSQNPSSTSRQNQLDMDMEFD